MADHDAFRRHVTLARIAEWEPGRRITCANCALARVVGHFPHVYAYCSAGWGEPRSLSALLHPRQPADFRPAATCPDFVAAF